jgi:hypothetical protein
MDANLLNNIELVNNFSENICQFFFGGFFGNQISNEL